MVPRIPNKNLQKMVRLQSLKGNLDIPVEPKPFDFVGSILRTWLLR